jgi:hypothetical protein
MKNLIEDGKNKKDTLPLITIKIIFKQQLRQQLN